MSSFLCTYKVLVWYFIIAFFSIFISRPAASKYFKKLFNVGELPSDPILYITCCFNPDCLVIML